MTKSILIPEQVVVSKIHHIRGLNVMLDDDLAELYQVDTKRLNEQVKRNPDRFPKDFMFQLSVKEWSVLRSQIATSKKHHGGRRYMPFVFTEYGVLMLSSILNSERAIQVNIQIVRIYARLRKVLADHKDVLKQLNRLERKMTQHDDSLKTIFDCLRELITPESTTHRKIGFRRKTEYNLDSILPTKKILRNSK